MRIIQPIVVLAILFVLPSCGATVSQTPADQSSKGETGQAVQEDRAANESRQGGILDTAINDLNARATEASNTAGSAVNETITKTLKNVNEAAEEVSKEANALAGKADSKNKKVTGKVAKKASKATDAAGGVVKAAADEAADDTKKAITEAQDAASSKD